ncbi:uncharacterized protein [Nicotiana sylvestris]|uniref:uncharacterized protein isoform X1 n=1 Tax=Nicotiana sylvestris TaxID=4096 RepID=UPI00388CD17E
MQKKLQTKALSLRLIVKMPGHIMLCTHNWWHVALCYLEGHSPMEKVRDVYDQNIWKELEKSDPSQAKVYLNAVGLLLRVYVRGGINVFGDRLKILADCLTNMPNNITGFYAAAIHQFLLLMFLCEHRSEWVDNDIDAYADAAVKVGPCSLPGARVYNFGGQVILPLAHTAEHEELLEVIKLELGRICHSPDDFIMPRYMFLLQVSSISAHGFCSFVENLNWIYQSSYLYIRDRLVQE